MIVTQSSVLLYVRIFEPHNNYMHCTLGGQYAYSINKNNIIVLQHSHFDLNDDDMYGSI